MEEQEYTVTCVEGHEAEVDIQKLSEMLEAESCPECGAAIKDVEPTTVLVECSDCEYEVEAHWTDVPSMLWGECPRCMANTDSSGNLHIVGTWAHGTSIFESFLHSLDSAKFDRKSRPDYTELVAHFTQRDKFFSILREDTIGAKSTGYFRLPAVCLTEVPLRYSSEIRQRFGPFGFAFAKSALLAAGGGPAVYLNDRVLRAQSQAGFSEDLKPFVNVYRHPSTAPPQASTKRVDFLFEREWRFPRDLSFSEVPPQGIILPDQHVSFYLPDTSWRGDLKLLGGWKKFSWKADSNESEP